MKKAFQAAFAGIDISRPWLVPFLPIHRDFLASFFTKSVDVGLAPWLNDYFNRHNIHPTLYTSATPLHFTPQDDLPHGTAYEAHIHATATIPTRNNLHDWFGACIWSVFPKSKALLNAKHVAHLNDDAHGNKRNRLRDTATLFDENGAILVISEHTMGREIATALMNFDWYNCLIRPRQHWHNPKNPNAQDSAKVFIFGHALLEQLVQPRKSLCSHSVILVVPASFYCLDTNKQLAIVDEQLCQHLDKLLVDGVSPKQLHPLPILGVPYFWAQNATTEFYQDPYVFRAGRHRKT